MKKNHRLPAILAFISSLTFSLFCLTGCARTAEPVTETGFYLDTVIQITLYENGNRGECSQRIKKCFSLIELPAVSARQRLRRGICSECLGWPASGQ